MILYTLCVVAIFPMGGLRNGYKHEIKGYVSGEVRRRERKKYIDLATKVRILSEIFGFTLVPQNPNSRI